MSSTTSTSPATGPGAGLHPDSVGPGGVGRAGVERRPILHRDRPDSYHVPIGQHADILPTSYPAAFRAELRRAFTAPYEAPVVVAVNAALVTGAWLWLPLPLQDLLFSLHGALAFPVVMATWMLADVPATNILGSDPQRTVAAIDDPAELRRLIYAKNAVLWLLVTPVCVVVAVGIGIDRERWTTTVVTIIGIIVVPIGGLGIAGWLGIYFPYHTLPLAERWRHRRPFGRMVVRWATLCLLPYALVPAITGILAAPAFAAWAATNGHAKSRIPDADLAVGVALTAVLSMAAFFLGHRQGLRFIRRRRDRLVEFLGKPELG